MPCGDDGLGSRFAVEKVDGGVGVEFEFGFGGLGVTVDEGWPLGSCESWQGQSRQNGEEGPVGMHFALAMLMESGLGVQLRVSCRKLLMGRSINQWPDECREWCMGGGTKGVIW